MIANFLVSRSRQTKRIYQAGFDALVLLLAFPLALGLRYESLFFLGDVRFWAALGLFVPCGILILESLGVYRLIVRHISTVTVCRLIIASMAAAALILIIAVGNGFPLPRSVPFIMMFVIGAGTVGGRFGVRALYRRLQATSKTPVIVYGAGDLGQHLVTSLQQGGAYQPLAIIDPTGELVGLDIAGIRVRGLADLGRILDRFNFTHVLLAIDTATPQDRARVARHFDGANLKICVVPSLSEILTGQATISDLRPIEIEELLGRDPVMPQDELIARRVQGKSVLVSGAGGSIGSELCRQIVQNAPDTLILVENSEFALYQINEELTRLRSGVHIVPVIACVTDLVEMKSVIARHRIDTIYHAAAYKHVPLVEENVSAGIENNVFGTEAIARAAHEAGVGSFTLISTDKAVRPTNVMGASKRVAELICQRFACDGSDTIFSIVRFGNVLGSSGSVIPLFRRQIEAGGPVTVTDPEITRYFMTIPEAAGLVLQASGMAEGGDTFLLHMGNPIRILDLAARMITLSGAQPFVDTPGLADEHALPVEGDIEIRFTGLRAGEKLHEELLIDAKSIPTCHPRIMRANEVRLGAQDLEQLLIGLVAATSANQPDRIRALLTRPEIGYRPAPAAAREARAKDLAHVHDMRSIGTRPAPVAAE